MTKQIVLGIDIGLRNLSMCILSKGFVDTYDYDILLWDNYNLLDIDTPKVCNSTFKNGKECNRVAQTFGNDKFYCKMHSKEHIKTVKKLPKVKNANSYTLQEISKLVFDKLTDIYNTNTIVFNSVTKVFIENQPKVNFKMKAVSILVLGKLTELLSENIPIRFMSASSKLGIQDIVESTASKKGTKGAKGYSNRKNLSVEYTRAFFRNKSIVDNEKWYTHFENRKKLNDMSDSLGFCICVLK